MRGLSRYWAKDSRVAYKSQLLRLLYRSARIAITSFSIVHSSKGRFSRKYGPLCRPIRFSFAIILAPSKQLFPYFFRLVDPCFRVCRRLDGARCCHINNEPVGLLVFERDGQRAFDEWLVRHSDQIIQVRNLGDLVSAALDEFINRHRDEFLPVEPLRLEQGRTQLSDYLGTK
jgi:hypothetical protein